jgi:hypothetical protein
MFTMTRRIGAAAASLAIAGSALIAVGLPAGAGAPALQVTPTTLNAGESVAANSTCSGTTVDLALYAGTIPSFTTPDGPPLATVTITLDGPAWDHDLTVPGGTAPGAYTVSAHCFGGNENYYVNASITVTAPPVQSSTTSAPTTTAVAPTTTKTPAAAAPAAAVPASPTYTG